jgi:hypothetical protein
MDKMKMAFLVSTHADIGHDTGLMMLMRIVEPEMSFGDMQNRYFTLIQSIAAWDDPEEVYLIIASSDREAANFFEETIKTLLDNSGIALETSYDSLLVDITKHLVNRLSGFIINHSEQCVVVEFSPEELILISNITTI